MSLLQSEEFAIYRLRTSYLANIHDGIGERLITIDTSFLNDPAYKAAGWSSNPPELKRTYSPPIPTAISSEYFKAPFNSGGRGENESDADEEDEGGMVTGVGNNDALGPTSAAAAARRRRRREQLEEDDSSDLSDESEVESDDNQRPANQIRFAKMPTRGRAGSSPLGKADKDAGPEVMVTSPSRPSQIDRPRRGSLGAVEAMKERARRDTTTSSDVSSENDLDPSVFQRRLVQATSAARSGGRVTGRISEDDGEQTLPLDSRREADEAASDSDDSSLASGFSEMDAPVSLLSGSIGDLQSAQYGHNTPPRPSTHEHKSSEQKAPAFDVLPELPPARPISTIQPVSALAAALKKSKRKPAGPFERFAALSGRGEPNPIRIKLYLPPEVEATEPLALLLRRFTPEAGAVTVAEAIGFALWRYGDEGITPAIPASKMNANWWTLRIVEDEEVDFDYAPLSRARPLFDLTPNSNRPTRKGASPAWDEFALVEASPAQFKENEETTPLYSKEAAEALEQASNESRPDRPEPVRQFSDTNTNRAPTMRRNPVTDPTFMPAAALDTPTTTPATFAVARTGAPKTLNVHFTDNNLTPHTMPIPCTTDTYIAEVFDMVCKKLNIDKALYVLKVTGTTTVAPSDRTVEALPAARQSLDLVRRRFIGDGAFGLSGSPGSTSPNAPLVLTTPGTPKRHRKGHHHHHGAQHGHPLAINTSAFANGAAAGTVATPSALAALNPNYRRYTVLRKTGLSFTPSHARVIALDGEYIHITPVDDGAGGELQGGAAGPYAHEQQLREYAATTTGLGKRTSVHLSSVVGVKVSRKHPKIIRLAFFKGREEKKYDFEARTRDEAQEIVDDIKRNLDPWRDTIAP